MLKENYKVLSMPYSTFKNYFKDCEIENYDTNKKSISILISLSDKRIQKIKFDTDWKRITTNKVIYKNNENYKISIIHSGNVSIYRSFFQNQQGFDTKDFIYQTDAIKHIIKTYNYNHKT